jgi:hypothetical protein
MKSMPLIERKVVAGNNICGGVCLYDTAKETGKFLSHRGLYLDNTVNF